MKYFFSLKARFTLFLALLAACALLVLAALNHIHNTTEGLKAVESARYQATQLATAYKALITAMTRDTMAFVSSEQPEFEQSYLQHLAILQGTQADAQGTQADMLTRFRQAGFTSEELALLEHAHTELTALIAIQKEAIGTAKGELDDGAGGIKIALPNTLLAKALVYGQHYTDAAAEIAAGIDRFDAMQSTRMAQSVDAASMQGQAARHIALAALIALMLSSALALRSLYRSIKRPLDQGIHLASRLAQGDLTAHIAQPRRDEPGRLIEALNGIRSSLHQTIQGIATRADHIGAVAHAITESHEDLQQRSETQTTMLQNTATTMAALAHTVRLNDERTTEARSLSRASDTCARQGEHAVEALADTMDHITHDADKISEATRLIRDIAFQTNILALNAAVEAAHAGPHGRGFSVVASEVRNLAQRCDLATRTITQLIEQALEHSREGAALALTARSAMKQVVQAVNENERLMGEIAAASQTQAASIRDTAQATHDIENITRHNTQRTHQAAQAIFGQRTEIEGLQQAMAQFKLELFAGQALRIGLQSTP